MRAFAEKRLIELKEEWERGQKQLAAHEARMAELRSTLLRIAGAIQVLEEVLQQPEPASSAAPVPLGRVRAD